MQTLIVVTPYRSMAEQGRVRVTRKLVEGLEAYQRDWPGPIRVLFESDPRPSSNLDEFFARPSELPFEVSILDFTSSELTRCLSGARVVLAAAQDRQTHLAAVCQDLRLPCVYVTEYTLDTRLQIARVETPDDKAFQGRERWERAEEVKEQAAIRRATGVQCNGTPTFEVYRHLNPRALLFFDSRTMPEDIITADALEARLQTLWKPRPLRLAFSGRFVAMKGVDHLPRIASHLRASGLDFIMTLCGAGDLEPRVRSEVARFGLERHFDFRGVLDFRTELLPFLRESVDLFVLPHVQGDPSCTYLETMAAGVPIVGYGNEAFLGILDRIGAGWAVPVGNAESVADVIVHLARDPARLELASRAARRFALENTFPDTFRRRIEHLLACSSVRG